MQTELWQVGEYRVSGAANTICLHGEEPVKLPPRLIDTLLYFARHAGEVISRKELVDNVWNRSVVTDQTVTQNIFELRKFLRGGRDRLHVKEYILTIPKRGYQLVVSAELINDLKNPSLAKSASAETTSLEQSHETLVDAVTDPEQEPCASSTPKIKTKFEDGGNPKKSGFKDFVKSFWLDENSAGFKRAAY